MVASVSPAVPSRRVLNLPFFAAAVRGISVIAWAGPGVAKSALQKAAARAMGYDFYQFLPSHHLPEELAGTPVVFRDDMLVKMLPFDFIKRLTEPFAWLLLDEFNTGSAMMRALLLSVTNERRIGGLAFHPTTVITAAANPPEMAPNAAPLEPSVANRFMHWQWQTPVDSWLMGLETGTYPDPVFPKFSNCELGDVAWGRKIRLFLESKPEFIQAKTVEPDELAFPTLRSWDFVKRGCAALESVQADGQDYADLVAGCVGKTAAAMFVQFASSLDLYSAKEVMEGTTTVDMKAPADRLIQLPHALIFHAQRMADTGELTTQHIDNAFIVLLELGERGHVDAVKNPLATIATIKPDYRPPAALRQRFGQLLSQIL